MKIIVMIPTYNESGNIKPLVEECLAQNPQIEVMVVDDHSPDGTGKIVAQMAAGNPRVHLFDRTGQKGRGIAGREGFVKALEMGADAVIEMDGDYSHHPRYLNDLIDGIKDHDIAIGSRFAEDKSGDTNRNFVRKAISIAASAYIRFMLGYKVKDPTSGYRCFTRRVLEGINVQTTKSMDPFIVTEILYRCTRMGYSIKECQIIFENRRQGESKLGMKILLGNIMRVAKLSLTGWKPEH